MLNLPQKFKNGFSGKAINVYPIVVINAGGNIIRLAQIKGMFDGEYYEDRNLIVSSINEKIDIADKKFQINQVTIDVSNYVIEQIRFSEKFKGFSFTNAEVEIYYANEGCDTLEDCLQIFKGFVKDYSGNQEKVSFSVEDHSQYTLDNKTFPRNKTYDPASETVDASKNVHFPVVYGHVDKSPIIFTRNNPASLTSYMFPDAVFTQDDERKIDILGFANNIEPLLIFRDDMYLVVPINFLDLPDDFYINGYDYSNYNTSKTGEPQYEISEANDRIILEKKLSEMAYTSGLPLNIQGRDQFQIEARREVTGVSSSSSESDIYEYGDMADIQYLGKKDGYDVLGTNQQFLFPDPQGDQRLLGFHKDFILKGASYGFIREDINREMYKGFSLWELTKIIEQSDPDGFGNKSFDAAYLPDATDILQYLNISNEYDGAEWITFNLESDEMAGSYNIANLTDQYFGTNFVSTGAYDFIENTASATESNVHSDLAGIRITSTNPDLEDIELMIDDDASEYFNPNVTAWITEINDSGEYVYNDDGLVCLRKILWGTRIYGETAVDSGLPERSWVFGLYPVLGQCSPKGNSTFDISQSEIVNSFSDFQAFEMSTVIDTLYSYKNPYLSNPSEPLNYEGFNSLYDSLIKWDYGNIDNNRLKFIKHNEEGWNKNERMIVTEKWDFWFANSSVPYNYSDVISLGVDATIGGSWCPITNNLGQMQAVKLDLTFNSLSGNDVVLGSVYSKLKGELTVDFYRNTSIDDNNPANYPHFYVECNAFKPKDSKEGDDLIQYKDILTNTEGYNGGIPTDELVYSFSTGYPSEQPDYSSYDFSTYTNNIKFPDENNPSVFFTDCNKYEDEDTDQWRQNINSLNNVVLTYTIGHPNQEQNDDYIVNGFFKTNISNFELHQRFIIGNTPQQKYFADVKGRIDQFDGRYTGQESLNEENINDDWLITKPSDILMHVMEKEFGYFNVDAFDQNSVIEARDNHEGWRFDFVVSKETKAKEFLSDFCKGTKLIPRFRHDGTFGFINIFQNYGESDIIINSADVSSFEYSKTPLSDVKLMVKVDYNYDTGLDQYTESTNFNNDGAVPVNYDVLQNLYNINSLEDAYLKVESKYIRDESTAIKLRNYLLEWNKNQHNQISCTLPPNYMHLECGDVVEFDSLIEDMTIFGEDYTQSYFVGGEDVDSGGQEILPYFIITDIKKSQKNVKVNLIQLHKINPIHVRDNSPDYANGNFYIPPQLEEDEEEVEETQEIVLGDINFDGSVDVLDIVAIVDMVVGSSEFNDNQFLAADVNQDNYVDILDVVQIVQSVVEGTDLGAIEV